MPFIAKSAAPRAALTALRHWTFERAAAGGRTLFAAPRGYLFADSLAATLAEHERPTLWLRLGPEDGDPATFLVSLIAAAQQLCPGVGEATLDQMRRRPARPPAGRRCSRTWGTSWPRALPPASALVIEHCHHLNDASDPGARRHADPASAAQQRRHPHRRPPACSRCAARRDGLHRGPTGSGLTSQRHRS